jgi:glucosylceramidase
MYIWELMQHYFTNSVVGYVYWNMILAEGGASTWGWKQNSMVTVDKTGEAKYRHEFYVMKHLARHVDPGAVRLGLKGQWTSNALAFLNPDGSVVLALSNPFANERRLLFQTESAAIEAMLEPLSINTLVIPMVR